MGQLLRPLRAKRVSGIRNANQPDARVSRRRHLLFLFHFAQQRFALGEDQSHAGSVAPDGFPCFRHFLRGNLLFDEGAGPDRVRTVEHDSRGAFDIFELHAAADHAAPLGKIGQARRVTAEKAAAVDLGIPEKQTRIQQHRGTDVAVPDGGVKRPERAGAKSDDGKAAKTVASTKRTDHKLDLFYQLLLIKAGNVEVVVALAFADARKIETEGSDSSGRVAAGGVHPHAVWS